MPALDRSLPDCRYEAWSCDDVDSVHNDYQRHLLYLWAYPEFELNKMKAWSTFAQDRKDGHVWESLGYTGKPMDVGGGRYMGDTTSLYLLEMYELLRHNGNKTFIQSQWSSAKRAVGWMIGNANSTYGLPQKLSTTYDHFGFHTHTTVAYNGHIYLTALAAVEAMATEVMQDTATATACATASALAKAQLIKPTSAGGPLWDADKKFWHAHSDTKTQIFTDTLYGQMLAHHHFNNYTLPMEMLEQHLSYEWCVHTPSAASCDPENSFFSEPARIARVVQGAQPGQVRYLLRGICIHNKSQNLHLILDLNYAYTLPGVGMRVLNDPIQEDSIWMNGPPTIAYLQLSFGKMDHATAIEPFKRMSENFRSRLRDQWNLRALTHTDGSVAPAETQRPLELGAPREQGH